MTQPHAMMMRLALLIGMLGSANSRHSSSSETVARLLSASAPKPQHRSLFGGYTNVICSLSEDTYPAIWDAGEQMFTFPDIDSHLENGTSTATENQVREILDELLADLTEGQDYQMVRLCWCTQYAQLPYEFCSSDFDTCMVTAAPEEGRPPVSCFHGEVGDTVIRSSKPIMIFWLIALMYAWFCTAHGKSARGFLGRVVCRRPAAAQLDAFLQTEPDRASYMYQQHMQRVRRGRQQVSLCSRWRRLRGLPVEEEEDALPEETQLKLSLKTKIFYCEMKEGTIETAVTQSSAELTDEENQVESNDNASDAGDDESSLSDAHCIICLLTLEDGDVIGDIPCGHLIHKDCLKDWLKRKNRCPLCQQPGIATLSMDK